MRLSSSLKFSSRIPPEPRPPEIGPAITYLRYVNRDHFPRRTLLDGTASTKVLLTAMF